MELIVPEENRILLTSLGDWDSDGYWSISPFPEICGLMMFDFAPDDSSKHATLSYPYIQPKIGELQILQYDIYKALDQQVGLCSFELTDGNYSITGSTTPPLNVQEWGFPSDIQIPPDWIEDTTQLIITFDPVPGQSFKIACSRFSLQYSIPYKTQYLPIMGVG
jgi:hypothetical protein